MPYDEIIYLQSQINGKDDIGNTIPSSTTSNKCYAKMQSVKTKEFYNATMTGLTPSCEFVIKRLNYHGESELLWNNTLYKVIRTADPQNKFDIVLVCEKKIGIKEVETSE